MMYIKLTRKNQNRSPVEFKKFNSSYLCLNITFRNYESAANSVCCLYVLSNEYIYVKDYHI